MDNAQKAIMIGVGLFITIIIISAVLLIVNLGTDLIDESTAKLDSISSSLQGSLTENYDGKIMTGSRVINAIKEYANGGEVSIVLYNKSNVAVAWTGAKKIGDLADVSKIGTTDVKLANDSTGLTDWAGDKTNLSDFSNNTKGEVYVNPSKQYKVSVVRTSADAVVGIVFQPVA